MPLFWKMFLLLLFAAFFQVKGFKIAEVKFDDWSKAQYYQCTLFNVSYHKNFTLQESEYIQLTIVNNDFPKDVNCSEVNSTFGICITRAILGDSNTLLNFSLHGLNSTTLLLSQEIPTKITARSGPLELHVEELTMNEVEIVWERPWKTFCYLSEIEFLLETFTTKTTLYAKEQPKTIRFDENDGSCNHKRSDVIRACSRKLTNLQADTQYIYKSKYTTEFSPSQWSEWSNILNFTTKSIVPSSSPKLDCELNNKIIEISWTSATATADIISLYFQLHYGMKIYTIKAQPDRNYVYRYQIDSELALKVFLLSCSNSGCSTLVNSKNSCVIEHDDSNSKIDYRWFLFLLLPISVLIVLVVFREHLWDFIEKYIKPSENGNMSKSTSSLIGPRDKQENQQANRLQGYKADHTYDFPNSHQSAVQGPVSVILQDNEMCLLIQ